MIVRILFFRVALAPTFSEGQTKMDMARDRVIRIAELAIAPDSLARYKALLAEEIEQSVRLEPGVLSLSAVSLRDDPTSVRILEVYASQEAYEDHLKSAHFLMYKAKTAGVIRSLKLLEADAIRLDAKGSERR